MRAGSVFPSPATVSRPHSARGFTLIEVLVALTLMALVSLISWRALDVVQRTQVQLDEAGQEVMAIVRVLGQLEHDVQQHASDDVLPPPPTVPAAQGAAPVARELSWLPPGIAWADDDGLALVRVAGDGRWQRVRWHLRNGVLWRGVGQASDQLPLPEIQTEYDVLSAVQAFGMRVWIPGQGWMPLPENEADQAGARVRAVELSLLPMGAPQTQAYRKVIMLP